MFDVLIINGNLVDGTVDSHLNPSLSQTALVFDNRAGAINQPAYARDYAIRKLSFSNICKKGGRIWGKYYSS